MFFSISPTHVALTACALFLFLLQKILALETELHRAHAEINNYKQQLAASEAAKTETGLKQSTSLPGKLSEDARWEDHLDAILGQAPKAEVSGDSDTEIVRLQKELEFSKSQHLSSCAGGMK